MPVPKGQTLDPARTRAAILQVATGVLYERGLDGVGIAELCRSTGISKETLYRHFGSKDGLVQAVLEARSERVINWMSKAIAGAGDDPADQLSAVFEAQGRWHAEPGFRGCAIINAAVQHHDAPVRAVARRHIARRLELLTGLANRAGAAEPDRLARQLLMLLTGATVVADHYDALDSSASGAADHAKFAALILLRATVASSQRRQRHPG